MDKPCFRQYPTLNSLAQLGNLGGVRRPASTVYGYSGFLRSENRPLGSYVILLPPMRRVKLCH